jgi:monovalent cation:H+ antiporter-2, CPA2 family
MHAEMTLISTLAAGLGLALVLGFIAVRLKLPALVGYLAAGIVIGPYSPGFVADAHIAAQCAELGIMLLMFGVGLHFSIEDLLAVRKIALPGALVQIAAATLLGGVAAYFWGWSIPSALVFGLALSVASTVVLLRALEDLGALDTHQGRIAIGWLVVEDLVMVLVLVLLPALSSLGGESVDAAQAAHALENATAQATSGGSLWKTLAITLGKVGLFIALMLVVGKRLFPWLLWQVAKTGSRELFTLSVIAAGVGIAYGSAHLFGISFAIGAFFAGMVLRESHLSYRAAEESLPLREAFSVLFFVSVGMLFDPRILIESPLRVVIVVFIIMFGKSIAAFSIVLAFRYPLQTALTVSASLAQIGEFSFILASLGVAQGLLPAEGQGLILAGAIISIGLNPLIFKAITPLQAWLGKRLPAKGGTGTTAGQVSHHAVLVGCGRVGSHILESLLQDGIGVVVADSERELVQGMRARGIKSVVGDASQPEVMIQAHIVRAKILILAIPDAFAARKMIETARMLNPKVHVIARADHAGDAEMLRREKVGAVFLSEHALANAMSREALAQMG